jgi:hypothetical protein
MNATLSLIPQQHDSANGFGCVEMNSEEQILIISVNARALDSREPVAQRRHAMINYQWLPTVGSNDDLT